MLEEGVIVTHVAVIKIDAINTQALEGFVASRFNIFRV